MCALVLAEEGNLEEAADRLHTSSTNVGRKVTALQKVWGVELLRRNLTGFELTDEGHYRAHRCPCQHSRSVACRNRREMACRNRREMTEAKFLKLQGQSRQTWRKSSPGPPAKVVARRVVKLVASTTGETRRFHRAKVVAWQAPDSEQMQCILSLALVPTSTCVYS